MKEFNLDNYKDINEFYAELAKELNEKLAGKTIGIKKMMLSSEYASAELQSFAASGSTVYVNCIHNGQPKKLSCNFMILNNMANPEDFDFSEYHELLKKAFKVQAGIQHEKIEADIKAHKEKQEAEKKAKKLKAMEEQYESNKKRLIERANGLIAAKSITPEKEFYVSLGYLAKHAKKVGAAMPDYLDGWLVNWAERMRGGHQRFYLTQQDITKRRVVSLRDNELTALKRGETTMKVLLTNKAIKAERGIYSYQNTIHEYYNI